MALAASRAANVWPCAAAVNLLRTPDTRIPQAHQFMLWWSGLRGAMAFAIALDAADALPGAPRRCGALARPPPPSKPGRAGGRERGAGLAGGTPPNNMQKWQ